MNIRKMMNFCLGFDELNHFRSGVGDTGGVLKFLGLFGKLGFIYCNVCLSTDP